MSTDLDRRLGARGGLLLAGIFLLALALRVWGLGFGLPYVFHFDEHWHMKIAYTLDPEMLIFPIFGFLQVMAVAAHQLLSWIEPVVRALFDSPEMTATLDSPTVRYHLASRWLSALLGAATVFPVYSVGRRLWGRWAGLAAALFMAVSFVHVRSSHFGVQDAPATFLAACSAAFAVRVVPRGPVRPYLLAGLFAGLATSTKFIAFPAFFLLVAVHLFGEPLGPERRLAELGRRLFDWRVWTGGLIGIAALVACMPQVWIIRERTIAFWRMTAAAGASGGYDRFALDPMSRPEVYLYAMWWGMGAVLTALTFAGAVLVASRFRDRRPLLLLTFPVLYFGFLLKPGYFAVSRYVVLVQPFLVLLAAAALTALVTRFAPPRWRPAVAAVAVLVAAVQPLAASAKYDSLLAGDDTRLAAKRWIEHNLPAGAVIVREGERWSPPLSTPKEPQPFSERSYRVFVKDLYGLAELSNMMGQFRGFATLDQYRKAGVQYLIANSTNRGMRLLDPEQDRQKIAFYETLEREAELVAEFSPYKPGAADIPFINPHIYAPADHLWRLERNGPRIRVYRIDGGPAEGDAGEPASE